MHKLFTIVLAALLAGGAGSASAAANGMATAAANGMAAVAVNGMATVAANGSARPAADEDGYNLWLRYQPLAPAAQAKLRAQARSIVWAVALVTNIAILFVGYR